MSDNAKKAALIVIVILAIGAAVYGGTKFVGGGEQMEVVKTIPPTPGFKSEKEKFLENQKNSTNATTPAEAKDADLGGNLTGK